MWNRKIASLALVPGLALTMSACGGAPSKDDLVERIQKQDVQPGAAACIADELLDSDLSDEQLSAIADDDESGLSDEEFGEAQEVLGKAAGSCATS